ncbi:NUDIX hydrolase [Hazenella coriacea]|uniref:ADP-ribose pyrophosphatase YjhB (NUDIX family) n=1 Tax=Hazenella coriacea TaxID=1179467 RepID=A0A4R3L9T3_9BACL|nr:NUDIX hydrolase [Hazenella coriacea]TCS96422.1 ADP-ribose pyrophosphatase YjhB (NUDIX family) [Hazenella coriacea]
MLSLTVENQKKFNFRVAGVIIHEDHICLHRGLKDEFWSLPGGRVEWNEDTRDAIIREMKEELTIEVEIQRLLWVVEDFFKVNDELLHELGFYYLLDPSKSIFKIEETFDKKSFVSLDERGVAFLYQWFPLEDLEKTDLYPYFLRESLNQLPTRIQQKIAYSDHAYHTY